MHYLDKDNALIYAGAIKKRLKRGNFTFKKVRGQRISMVLAIFDNVSYLSTKSLKPKNNIWRVRSPNEEKKFITVGQNKRYQQYKREH